MAKRKRGHGQTAAGKDPSFVDPADAKLNFKSYEDLADSEDEFHINRDKITFGASRHPKRAKQNDAEPLELSDEEVLAYSDSESQDSESGGEEQDGGSQAYSGGENESESDDAIEGWGSSKADYYNTDKVETEQDALDEEAEARRIQQKRLRALREADFGFDENEWLESGKTREDTELGRVVTEVLPQIQITDDMSSVERLKLLKTRYPEFEPLAKELVDLQSIHAQLAKDSKTERTYRNGTSPAMSAMSPAALKYNALSGYLGSLAMYFAVLSSTATSDEPKALPLAPQELREHEIMDSLVRCRALWERVKDLRLSNPPLEQEPQTKSETIEEAQRPSETTTQSEKHIRRTAKPNIKEAHSGQSPLISASEARREAGLRRTEESLAALSSKINSQQLRAKNQVVDSESLIQPSTGALAAYEGTADQDSDLGDEPMPSESAGRRKKSLKFYTSQLVQKANKRANAGRNTGGDEDVPHRERLRDRQERLNREAERRAQKGGDIDAALDGDEETNREREARSDNAEDDEAAALEDQVLAKKAAKARRREDAATRDPSGSAQLAGDIRKRIADAEANGRREVGYAIEKNKGLAPRRKKEVRNPRVKKRLRFEDKSKKLRSMRATYKGGEGKGGYGGELTGIKKGLVRSVKL